MNKQFLLGAAIAAHQAEGNNVHKEPFVYITGRRFVNRAEEEVEVKIYSNQKEMSLYQNEKFIGSTDSSVGSG